MPDVRLRFTSDLTGANSGIDKIKQSLSSLKSVGAGIGSVLAKGLAALTAGLVATGAAAVAGLKDIIDYAGEIKDIADSTGVSIKALIDLREQFRQAGVDTGKLQSVLANLSSTLESPDDTTTNWLDKWGVSLEEIQSMGVADRFEVIRKKIGEMSSEAERLSASKDFFGKAGADLVRLFSDVDAKVNAEKMLGDLPATMQLVAGTLESAGDKFDGLSIKWNQFFAGFASQLLDPITQAAGFVEQLDLTNWGVKAGMFVNGMIDAFKNGTLEEILTKAFIGGFKLAIVEIGAILTYVIGRAAFAGFQWAVNKIPALKVLSAAAGAAGANTQYEFSTADAWKKAVDNPLSVMSLGSIGGLFTKKNADYNQEADISSLSEYRDFFKDMFKDVIQSGKDDLLGLINTTNNGWRGPQDTKYSSEDWAKMIQASKDKVAEQQRITAENATLHDDVFAAMTGFKDSGAIFLNSLVTNKEKITEGAFKDIAPVVSSLGRIGGAKGETNSVLNFQNTSLMYQKQIAQNTSKMLGGAIIG
jgi:hypothetical protein